MFLTFFTINKMASAVAMMIGGAVVNALAFTGSNFLFSKLGKNNDAEAESERHDKAVEQLEAAQAAWSQKRTQIWLVGCFGFNGPLRQYFSLYRAVSQREGERGEKG